MIHLSKQNWMGKANKGYLGNTHKKGRQQMDFCRKRTVIKEQSNGKDSLLHFLKRYSLKKRTYPKIRRNQEISNQRAECNMEDHQEE